MKHACAAQHPAGQRTAGSLFIGVALLVLGCSSSSAGATKCSHPCDLVQTVRIAITGGVPASVAVSDPCGGGGTCGAVGCGPIDVYLKSPCAAAASDVGGDLVCHVVITSTAGQTVEADLTAQYTAAACCSGWEFPASTWTLSFGSDGGGG